jgi:hypothetical protein
LTRFCNKTALTAAVCGILKKWLPKGVKIRIFMRFEVHLRRLARQSIKFARLGFMPDQKAGNWKLSAENFLSRRFNN